MGGFAFITWTVCVACMYVYRITQRTQRCIQRPYYLCPSLYVLHLHLIKAVEAPPPPSAGMTKALIEERELHVEASESYLSYAMSVIVGR